VNKTKSLTGGQAAIKSLKKEKVKHIWFNWFSYNGNV